MSNEFNTILTDRILSNTVGNTIQVDSTISFNAGSNVPVVSSPITHTNFIDPFTPLGDVTVRTNLNVQSGSTLRSNAIAPVSGLSISVGSALVLGAGFALDTNVLGATSGGLINVNDNVVLIAGKNLKSDTLDSTSGGAITSNQILQVGTNSFRFGATNTSQLYEAGGVPKLQTPLGSIYSLTNINLYSATIANNATGRTCVSNASYYAVAINPATITTNVVQSFGTVTGAPNTYGVQYSGTPSREAVIDFIFSYSQSVNVGNPVMLNAIAVNPTINAVSGLITTITLIQLQRQLFTSSLQTGTATVRYYGPVATNDTFYLVHNHATNNAVVTVQYMTVTCTSMSLGLD